MDDADGGQRGCGLDLDRACCECWETSGGWTGSPRRSTVDHDAVMNSWPRLESGMGLLAQLHNLLRHLEVGEVGRRPRFANHLEPAAVASAVRRGVERIRSWDPTPAERRLVDRYDVGLDLRLSAGERAAPPLAMACQPLSRLVVGGAVGRSDGGAAPRRRRRARPGGGTAAHARAGPLAGHVRLTRTPRWISPVGQPPARSNSW